MDWLTPTIAGASALGSAAIGGASTAVNNKRQLKYTKKLMDYQWQNYGSPSAQMAAAHAAGINPNASEVQAQQPQVNEMSTLQNPVMNALSIFSQLIPQVSNMISQSYNNDLVTQQTEGTTLENLLKKYDLGELKPLQKKQLERIIDNLEKSGQLTDKQISKVSAEIVKLMSESKGIDIDNLRKQLEYDWQRFKYDEGAPSIELDILKNQRTLQNLDMDLKTYEKKHAGREDEYEAALYDTKKKFELQYYQALSDMEQSMKRAFSHNDLPEGQELQSIVGPLARGLMYMLFIKMAEYRP